MIGLNDSKRAGTFEAMNAGAKPLVSRLRRVSRNVPREKIEPAACATPGVRCTFSTICWVTGEVSERTSRPSVSAGVTTTSWPLLAVWKIDANELLIVSVRM